MFPTKKVKEITHTDSKASCAQWDNGTLADLRQLVKIEAADVDERQNHSPSIGQFLEILAPYEARITLLGYVVYPPRSDKRVSVEGFILADATKEEVDTLLEKCGSPDELDDGRFWWD